MRLLFVFLSFISSFLTSCSGFQDLTVGGVESPKIKTLSTDGIEGEFSMRIKNPNKMAVTVYPSTFDAMVNDISVGKVKLNKRVRIRANSDDISTFNIKSDFSKLSLSQLPQILSIVAGKNVALYLKGDLKAGTWFFRKKFPVELKKSISLTK